MFGKDFYQNSLTCQKDEEKSCAIKKDELEEQNDTNEPLTLTLHHLVHDNIEHGVEVDGYQAHGNTNDIVEVVETDEVSTWLVSGDEVYDLHAEND